MNASEERAKVNCNKPYAFIDRYRSSYQKSMLHDSTALSRMVPRLRTRYSAKESVTVDSSIKGAVR